MNLQLTILTLVSAVALPALASAQSKAVEPTSPGAMLAGALGMLPIALPDGSTTYVGNVCLDSLAIESATRSTAKKTVSTRTPDGSFTETSSVVVLGAGEPLNILDKGMAGDNFKIVRYDVRQDDPSIYGVLGGEACTTVGVVMEESSDRVSFGFTTTPLDLQGILSLTGKGEFASFLQTEITGKGEFRSFRTVDVLMSEDADEDGGEFVLHGKGVQRVLVERVLDKPDF